MTRHFLSIQQLQFQGAGGAEVTLSLSSSFVSDTEVVFVIRHCHSQVISLCSGSTCLSNTLRYIDGSRRKHCKS